MTSRPYLLHLRDVHVYKRIPSGLWVKWRQRVIDVRTSLHVRRERCHVYLTDALLPPERVSVKDRREVLPTLLQADADAAPDWDAIAARVRQRQARLDAQHADLMDRRDRAICLHEPVEHLRNPSQMGWQARAYWAGVGA